MPADPRQDARDIVLGALEESAFHAARHRVPAARLVQGPPGRIWDTVTQWFLGTAESEYLGFDDPSVLALGGMSEHMVVRGSGTMADMIDRRVRVRQVTTPAGVSAPKGAVMLAPRRS